MFRLSVRAAIPRLVHPSELYEEKAGGHCFAVELRVLQISPIPLDPVVCGQEVSTIKVLLLYLFCSRNAAR